MPLKKVFNLEEETTCEVIKKNRPTTMYIGFVREIASFRSLGSTFLNTRYKESAVTAIFNRSLRTLQSFFLSIKNASYLIGFTIRPFKICAYVDLSQNANGDQLDSPKQ